MSNWMLIVLGLVLVVAGGELLVRGAVATARRLGVSPLLIGLTLVGFGTSTPELITSVEAALAGSPGIAVGNVVGSNTANILLILGVAAVIFPLATSRAALIRDGGAMLVAALACLAVVLTGHLDRIAGAVLLVLLAVYIGYTYRREKASHDASATMHEAEADFVATPAGLSAGAAAVLALAGIGLTILGATYLVDGAIDLARAAGVSETVVGLTIVSVGTSLPELVTSVMAALRRQGDVAFGNVLGSNIYNVLGILGVTALVKPIPVPPEIASLDIWVMMAATLAMLVFAVTGWRLSRVEGGLFLAAYAGYVAYLASIV